MKRGLKADCHCDQERRIRSYNRCPDEKGTESQAMGKPLNEMYMVTTVAPMKRGLKDHRDRDTGRRFDVTTVAPMKRGLKDLVITRAWFACGLQPLPR